MTLSTLVRLLAGVVLFVFLARMFGPADFGRLMYAFSIATLASLVIEYGFSSQILRDIARAPEQIKFIMARVFFTKIILVVLVVIGSAISFEFLDKSAEEQNLFWLLFISCAFASFADFFNVAFRAIGQFHEETKVATIASLFHFFLLLGLATLQNDLILLGQGFILSRIFNLTLSWFSYKKIVGGLDFTGTSFKQALQTLKSGFPYAADTGFINFFAQVDILIVNHFLGPVSVGIYQAGMRFMQGANQFAPVLGNIFIPAIAGAEHNPAEVKKLTKKLNTQMFVVGFLGWAIFAFGGQWITHYIYGEKFAGINPLWPHIGFLLFIRYIVASQGVILTARGAQSVRVYAQIIGLCVLFSISQWLIKEYELVGMLLAMQATMLTVYFTYMLALLFKKIPTGFTFLTALASVTVGLVAMIMFVRPNFMTDIMNLLNEISIDQIKAYLMQLKDSSIHDINDYLKYISNYLKI